MEFQIKNVDGVKTPLDDKELLSLLNGAKYILLEEDSENPESTQATFVIEAASDSEYGHHVEVLVFVDASIEDFKNKLVFSEEAPPCYIKV